MADDWQNGQFDQPAEADDFEMPEAILSGKSVEEMEQEAADREFQPPDLGVQKFEIAGFLKYPEPVTRDVYVGSEKTSYNTMKVAVRLAVVGDPHKTILDFFDLPPSDPTDLRNYQFGGKTPNANSVGFQCQKFDHFIQRIGFPYAKGGKLPKEALRIGNWRGRRVHAEIVAGREDKDRVDPSTGRPYPPKPQVKLYSYRTAEETIEALNSGGSVAQPAPLSASRQEPVGAAVGAPPRKPRNL